MRFPDYSIPLKSSSTAGQPFCGGSRRVGERRDILEFTGSRALGFAGLQFGVALELSEVCSGLGRRTSLSNLGKALAKCPPTSCIIIHCFPEALKTRNPTLYALSSKPYTLDPNSSFHLLFHYANITLI